MLYERSTKGCSWRERLRLQFFDRASPGILRIGQPSRPFRSCFQSESLNLSACAANDISDNQLMFAASDLFLVKSLRHSGRLMSLSRPRIKKILKLAWSQLYHAQDPDHAILSSGSQVRELIGFSNTLLSRLANLIFDVYAIPEPKLSCNCEIEWFCDPFLQGLSVDNNLLVLSSCPKHDVPLTMSAQLEALVNAALWPEFVFGQKIFTLLKLKFPQDVALQRSKFILEKVVSLSLREVSRRNNRIRNRRNRVEFKAGFRRWSHLRMVCSDFKYSLGILFPKATALLFSMVKLQLLRAANNGFPIDARRVKLHPNIGHDLAAVESGLLVNRVEFFATFDEVEIVDPNEEPSSDIPLLVCDNATGFPVPDAPSIFSDEFDGKMGGGWNPAPRCCTNCNVRKSFVCFVDDNDCCTSFTPCSFVPFEEKTAPVFEPVSEVNTEPVSLAWYLLGLSSNLFFLRENLGLFLR